jgi:hypothetical protein
MVGTGAQGPVRIGAIAHQRQDSSEVVVLRFDGATGASACPAPTGVLLSRERRVVRLLFDTPAVEGTTWTDTVFTTGVLVTRACVLRTLEGRVAVDLHLGAAVLARAAVGGPDSALVVALQPGGDPLPPPTPFADRVVLLRPRDGDTDAILRIEGYARTFEATVQVQARGRVAADTFTTAADYLDMWGEFGFEWPAAAGADTVRVGEYDMESGAWHGVAVIRRPR